MKSTRQYTYLKEGDLDLSTAELMRKYNLPRTSAWRAKKSGWFQKKQYITAERIRVYCEQKGIVEPSFISRVIYTILEDKRRFGSNWQNVKNYITKEIEKEFPWLCNSLRSEDSELTYDDYLKIAFKMLNLYYKSLRINYPEDAQQECALCAIYGEQQDMGSKDFYKFVNKSLHEASQKYKCHQKDRKFNQLVDDCLYEIGLL